MDAFGIPCRRIEAIRATLLATPCSICLERPLLIRRFSLSRHGRRTRKSHPLVRRAWLLHYLLSRRRPRIYDHELIVGNMSSKRIGANYYPEGGSLNVLEDLFRMERRRIPLALSAAEKIRLVTIGVESLFRSIGGKALLRPGRLSHFVDFFRARRYFVTEAAGIAHQVGDYGTLIRHGLAPADETARRALCEKRSPQGATLTPDQVAFYRSVRIVVRGIRAMARNLARAAQAQAGRPGVPAARRAELLRAAEACRHVPYHPPRSFIEALQSCWLVHVALNQEDFEQGMSFGRLDRFLHPLYRKEIEAGTLTREAALEAVASFQLKTCETIPIYSERIDQFFSGNGVAQGITLGGVDEAGEDTTNDLSSLFLEAYAWIRTREPALHVRVHDRTPPDFLARAVEVVRLGCGKPSFFGDAAVIRALETTAGMSRAHARDYAVIGCVEMGSQGRTYNSSDAALFNLPLCLELALNQGRPFAAPPRSRPLGAATPPAAAMTRFEELLDALRRQVEDAVARMAQVIGYLEQTYRLHRSTPINSIMTQGCLEKGRDVTWGGALYDLTSIQVAGLADTGDSLLAVRRMVYEERRFPLDRLVSFLKADFKGFEPLQSELLHKFPRFGNGQAEADGMTQLAADIFSGAVLAQRNSRGGRYVPGIYSMTCHVGFGRITGALPNGRRAGARLSNGLSPSDGSDRNGPTALLRSAASLDSSRWANCCALNLKFDPAAVRGPVGAMALGALFRNYFRQGGMQLQPNVLDAEVLKAARRDPAAYPGIVVRVAGYCAYFNDLQAEVQEEIIARTTHGA
jgi:pyruvate formate-lyase/glycerol dehydratase family glycyl radical enzyme